MENLTYRDLLNHLNGLDPHELDMTVTVFVVGDEFYPVRLYTVSGSETDVLDEGHPYLIV